MPTYDNLDPSFPGSILELLPDPIVWVRPVLNTTGAVEDFEIGYANKAAQESILYPTNGTSTIRILRDDIPSRQDAEANFNSFLEVYQSGRESRYLFYTGEGRHQYEAYRKPCNGGVLSTMQDRRALQEAEQKEEKARRVLQSIVESSPNGIAVFDAVRDKRGNISDFKLRYYNTRRNELLGLSPEEGAAFTFPQVLQIIGSNSSFDRYAQVVETGQSRQWEQYVDKSRKWLFVSAAKLDDGFLAMTSDITELKRSQQILQESQRYLHQLLEAQLSILVVVTPEYNEQGAIENFRYKMLNNAASLFLPDFLKPAEGKLVTDVFPSFKETESFDRHIRAYQTGQPEHYTTHYNKDGMDIWFEVLATRIGGDLMVCHHDLTESRKLQLNLERLVEELRRSNESLEEFAYAASHDLQEPLRKIQFFSERLRTNLSGADADNAAILQRMEASTVRMRVLIDDLLAYSQVSTKAGDFEMVDLDKVVDHVLHDLETVIHQAGAVVTKATLPSIEGDERQLRQMFQNLIGNALKYRKPDNTPRISIGCRIVQGTDPGLAHIPVDHSKGYYLIEVSDNGIGFEQENAEKIFQVFQRLHGRSEYEGTGVGLAIVLKVVANHKGFIWAEAQPGVGATFRVVLPTEGAHTETIPKALTGV